MSLGAEPPGFFVSTGAALQGAQPALRTFRTAFTGHKSGSFDGADCGVVNRGVSVQ